MSNNNIITSAEDGVRLIKFNRPNKKNALLSDMYLQITNILNEDAINDSIVVTIFTGEGEYYSSGNDFVPEFPENQTFEQIIDTKVEISKNFVRALIDYPKLLIAVVNGPAIGITVTTLALFDIVYATEGATFATPFIKLRLCPEACSSFLFPRLLGRSKASELLLLGETMTAEDALKRGFISKIVPLKQLANFLQHLRQYGRLPVKTVITAKTLINCNLKEVLHKTNDIESDVLAKCLGSEEFMESMINFSSRKSKL